MSDKDGCTGTDGNNVTRVEMTCVCWEVGIFAFYLLSDTLLTQSRNNLPTRKQHVCNSMPSGWERGHPGEQS